MDDEVKVNDAVITQEVKTDDVKTFDQNFLNDKIGQAKKSEREKLLKELGIEDVTNAKESLRLFKEKQEAEKSETQKLKDQIEALNKEKNDILTKSQIADAKFLVIAKGVNTEKAEKVVKIAMTYEGESLQDKIDAVLIDFPEFVKPVSNAPANIGSATGKQEVSEDEQMKAQMRKAMGIK